MKRTVIGWAWLLLLGAGCIGWTGGSGSVDWNYYPPPADEAAATEAARGNREFAIDLYSHLCGKAGNLFFSPFSISTALAMTRAGAKGDTAAQMDKTLHFALPQDRQDAAFAALLRTVNAGAHGCRLSTANALWGQEDAGFTPEFLKRTRDYYGAGLQEVDFKKAPEQARRRINAWVERQTNDKIKDLIPDGMLSSDSRLVLTNAIYFKGDWARRFQKKDTEDGPFHLTAKQDVKAPLMHQTDAFGYLDADGLQVLEMPYVGGDLTMVVLLPHQVDGLAELEAALTAEKLDAYLHNLVRQDVIVTFPKFKAEYLMNMGDSLSRMGMSLAFSGSADFSGMNGGKEPLQISDVIHKAWIDTNEEGTEAAAATGIHLTLAAEVPPPSPPKPVFRADHPFLFLIRDKRSGAILFLGRVADPTR